MDGNAGGAHTSGRATTRMAGAGAYVRALDDGWYRVQCPICSRASMRARKIDVAAQLAAAHRQKCLPRRGGVPTEYSSGV